MRAVCLLPLCAALLLGVPARAARGDELPPAVREALDAYEKDVAEVQKKAEQEAKQAAEKVAGELKLLQDRFCKEAKLDEAVAIRDQIRQLRGGPPNPNAADLPAAAKEVLGSYEKDLAEVQKRAEGRIKKSGARVAADLKALQDRLCKEAKLDEAVAVRDLRRRVQFGVVQALPDPGVFDAPATDVGKVLYFEVTGSTAGSTWGTDVYTTQSSLAATAVHAGALRDGQKGVIKVTVLPGQLSYASTTRNGVTSSSWGQWGVSFKVERVLGVAPAVAAPNVALPK